MVVLRQNPLGTGVCAKGSVVPSWATHTELCLCAWSHSGISAHGVQPLTVPFSISGNIRFRNTYTQNTSGLPGRMWWHGADSEGAEPRGEPCYLHRLLSIPVCLCKGDSSVQGSHGANNQQYASGRDVWQKEKKVGQDPGKFYDGSSSF